MQKKSDNLELTLKISTITKWMMFGGLLLIVFSKITSSYLEDVNIIKSILSIIEVIGTTLLSAGLVSVIVEISTIKSLVSNAFKNILCGNFALDGLSMDTLNIIKKNIVVKTLDLKNRDLLNTPYKYEKNLLNCVNEKYYDYHNVTYHITPDSKNNCFHIKTKIDYSIVNKNLIDNNFEVRLKLYKIPDSEKDYRITNNFSASVIINDKKIPISDILSIEPVTHNSESTYYNCKIRIFKELEHTKNKIKAELNYDVPMFDSCQSFKISAPCKNIEHKFYINKDSTTNEEWMIQANAYSTFYHRQDEEGSNYKVEQNVDDSLIIRYTDWALVGNGYCVFYQKKS